MRRSAAIVAALLLAAAGCARRGPVATLEIVASSELADMTDMLDEAESETGVQVDVTYTGSLRGAERIAAGTGADAAWLASDRYLALVGASSKALDRTSIMQSPVVVGVKRSVASALGWMPPRKLSWMDIAEAASEGRFRYAMTDPTASNSGFSGVVGVATALNEGKALEGDGMDTSGLKGFFTGQARTSGSSGPLAEAYAQDQRDLDGIVNYESVLIRLNESGDLDEPLELIYPDEGITTADYPLVLLDRSKREGYEDLVGFLRSEEIQRRIVKETARRPAVREVRSDDRFDDRFGDRFGDRTLVEAPFPANLDVARRLVDEFSNEIREPAHTFYVLDTPASTKGQRLDRVKRVMNALSGLDGSFSLQFTRPPPRELVTVLIATSDGTGAREFDIDWSGGSSSARTGLRRHVDALEPAGKTLLYTTLLRAYELAGRAQRHQPHVFTSIVVITEAEISRGLSHRQFERLLAKQAPAVRRIPAYTVLLDPPTTSLFRDSIVTNLEELAQRSGGKVYDARDADLSALAKEIRGYK